MWSRTEPGREKLGEKKRPNKQRNALAERIIFVYGACNQLQGVPVKQGYWASMRSGNLPCYSVKGVISFGPQMADILVLRFTIFLGILKFLEFLKISNPSVIIFKHRISPAISSGLHKVS